MTRHVFRSDDTTFTRITKAHARKLWELGEGFALCPVNLRPGFPWASQMWVNSKRLREDGRTFEQIVNEFVWYNCTGRETGTYPAYYAQSVRIPPTTA